MAPETKRALNRLGWLAAVGSIILFVAIVASDSKGGSSTPAATAPAPIITPLAVTARHLYRDYRKNEISADAKYKGKTLAVTGVVASINRDFANSPYLLLETGDFLRIRANLQESETRKAGVISIGDSVTVICEGDGMMIGMPVLSDCMIQ
jgi:hypothetical protein